MQPNFAPEIVTQDGDQRLLGGKNRILEMLALGEPLTQILEQICLLTESFFAGSYVSILLLDANGVTLRKAASPSSPPAIRKFLEQGVDVDENTGPCGRAAFTRQPEIIDDLLVYKRDEEFRGLLSAHDLQAAWSLPVISSSARFLGTLSLYLCSVGKPSGPEKMTLEQMMHLSAIAIEQSEAGEKLRRSEAHLATAQRLTSTGSFCWNAATFEMTWSDETYRICEVARTVTPTGEMTRDLFHPDDLHLFRQMLEGAEREYSFECRLRVLSGIKHIQVVGIAERDQEGRLREWVGTFMDITERKKTADALRASEHLARVQVEAMSQTLALMSRESDPEKILRQVLCTVCRQLQACSLGVWEIAPDRETLAQVAICEDDCAKLIAADELANSPRIPVPRDERSIAEQVREQLDEQGCIRTLRVPLLVEGRVGALIMLRFQDKRSFDRTEMDLTQALLHQAALALQLCRLSQQNRQVAVLAERNRFARDIHDTLAQSLTGIVIQLRAARDAAGRNLSSEADGHLVRAAELAREGLAEARRSVRALRPRILKEASLIEALEDMFGRMTVDSSMKMTLSTEGHPYRLAANQETDFLRISQEVLTNALKHAQATRLAVRVLYSPERFEMEFHDNGCGFDAQGKFEGFGLIGMRERIENNGGSMILDTTTGTRITLSLPLVQ